VRFLLSGGRGLPLTTAPQPVCDFAEIPNAGSRCRHLFNAQIKEGAFSPGISSSRHTGKYP
jgi:hypothetical protein